jgi:hypothetical protein
MTEQKAFPTHAEATSAIAALRRQTWPIAAVRHNNKIPSDAVLWAQLDPESKLRFAGTPEGCRTLNAILGRIWAMDGNSVREILDEAARSMTDDDGEVARFGRIQADGLAWIENLTAEQYERFAHKK